MTLKIQLFRRCLYTFSQLSIKNSHTIGVTVFLTSYLLSQIFSPLCL